MHIKTAVPIVIVQKKAAAMCLLSELSMIFRKSCMKKGMSISSIENEKKQQMYILVISSRADNEVYNLSAKRK